MTRDERAMTCADIFGKALKTIYPLLTRQFIATEGTRELERRFDGVREKILAGDESLFDELTAIAQQWGLAVLELDQAMPELPKPEQIPEPAVIAAATQVNLFAQLQK